MIGNAFGWVAARLIGLVSPRYVQNWARHITAYLGGLVTMLPGVAPELVEQWAGPTEVIISGVIMLVISVVMSIGNAKQNEKS